MSYVYAYAPDDDGDCSTIGLVGSLVPTKCEFSLEAGAFGELTLNHPKDAWGKWRALTDGAILKASVPCRLAPNVSNGAYVSKVEVWTVNPTAAPKDRALYKKANGKSKITTVAPGAEVTYVSLSKDGKYAQVKYSTTVKAKSKKKKSTNKTYTGYLAVSVLKDKVEDIATPQTSAGAEQANTSYVLQDQLFRIYKTTVDDKSGGSVSVSARRIPYDLLGNLCTYVNRNADIPGTTVCEEVLNNTVADHPFSIFTDISDTRSAVDYANVNPIEALLSEDKGVASRWNAQVINDDFNLYFLHSAGMDRGVRIEYGKNLKGIKCDVDTSDVAVGIRPKGTAKNGDWIYLTGDEILPSGYEFDASKTVIYKTSAKNRYPVPKVYGLNSKATVSDDVKIAEARRIMTAEAIEKLDAGCEEPTITLTVEYIMLGDTEEYEQFKGLESLFVYDTVHVRHKPLGISSDIVCVAIKWNCITDLPISATFGALEDVSANVASWQIPSSSGGQISSGGTIYDGTVSYASLTDGCKNSILSSVLQEIRKPNSDIANAIKALFL